MYPSAPPYPGMPPPGYRPGMPPPGMPPPGWMPPPGPGGMPPRPSGPVYTPAAPVAAPVPATRMVPMALHASEIGGFVRYVGKKFLIRCKQDERYAIDTCQNQGKGGDIIIWDASRDNPNQVWTVDMEGHIINVAHPDAVIYARGTSDECHLAVTGSRENMRSHGNRARWTLTADDEIACIENPNQMMNVCGARMQNRATMITWHKQGRGSLNDKWRIDVIGDYQQGSVVQPLGEMAGFVGTRFYIRIRNDPNFVVDSAVKQRSGGGDTHLWSDTRNNNPNQIWTLDQYGHIIIADTPSEPMALVPVRCEQGANVALCRMSDAALMSSPISMWSMNSDGEIVCLANPNLMLNVCGAQKKNGSKLIIWGRQGPSAWNDKWRIDMASSGYPQPGYAVPQPGYGYPQPGYGYAAQLGEMAGFVGTRFYIKIRSNPNFVADSAVKQRSSGGDTHLWSDTRNNNPNQIWTLDQYGHIIIADTPREPMALVPVKCEQGAHVALCRMADAALMGSPISMWTMNSAGEIVSQANPNLMLNVCGGQLKNGAALILWCRQGASACNDKWILVMA